jgi:hypothetical protein
VLCSIQVLGLAEPVVPRHVASTAAGALLGSSIVGLIAITLARPLARG